MSATKDESGADASKKGRFTVKFADGRRKSEDPEIGTPTDIQELPPQNGS